MHTKEPWRVKINNISKTAFLITADAKSAAIQRWSNKHPGVKSGFTESPTEIASLAVYWNGGGKEFGPDALITTKEVKANATRIVSCVNALAGLNPNGIKGLVEAAEFAYDACFDNSPIDNESVKQRLEQALKNLKGE